MRKHPVGGLQLLVATLEARLPWCQSLHWQLRHVHVIGGFCYEVGHLQQGVVGRV